MNQNEVKNLFALKPKLSEFSIPAKMLVTMIILMMAIGLAGALGQIIVHDVIPTFWDEKMSMQTDTDEPDKNKSARGDLFATAPSIPKAKPFYQTDEFIFALKFVHIHLFGMSLIFILMGGIVLFLDLSTKVRTWLVVLPFIGVGIDLASVWLKVFIHPAFFWLHIPGGALFGTVFAVVAILSLWEMWRKKN